MKLKLFIALMLFNVLACSSSNELPDSGKLITPIVRSGGNSRPKRISVHFSPNGGATDNIVTNIQGAKHSILMQAYSFTSRPIAEALVAARENNIQVELLADRSEVTSRDSQLNYVVSNGITAYIDSEHAIAHNKVIVVDNTTVLTGSFNFTKAAEKSNAENSVEIIDPELAQQYTENWKLHKEHSVLYEH